MINSSQVPLLLLPPFTGPQTTPAHCVVPVPCPCAGIPKKPGSSQSQKQHSLLELSLQCHGLCVHIHVCALITNWDSLNCISSCILYSALHAQDSLSSKYPTNPRWKILLELNSLAWRENGAGKAPLESWNCTALELPQVFPAATAATEQGHCCPYPHCLLPALPLAISRHLCPCLLSCQPQPHHCTSAKSRATKC